MKPIDTLLARLLIRQIEQLLPDALNIMPYLHLSLNLSRRLWELSLQSLPVDVRLQVHNLKQLPLQVLQAVPQLSVLIGQSLLDLLAVLRDHQAEITLGSQLVLYLHIRLSSLVSAVHGPSSAIDRGSGGCRLAWAIVSEFLVDHVLQLLNLLLSLLYLMLVRVLLA